MSYKVTISNNIILQDCIEFVSFRVKSSPDDYKGKAYPLNSMIIEGKIGTDEKIIPLYQWSLISSTNPECYKEITVEQTHADQLIRKVTFSKAFVVDYSESHTEKTGEGYFSLCVRQFVGIDVEASDGQAQAPPTSEIADVILNRKFTTPQSKEYDSMKIVEGMGGRPTDTSERFTEEKVREELATSKVGRQTLDFIDKHNIPVGLTYEPRTDGALGVCLKDSKVVKVFLTNHDEGIKQVAQTVIHEVTHFMGVQGSKKAELYCRIRELKHTYKDMRIPKKILKAEFDQVYKKKSYSNLPEGSISEILSVTKGWVK